MRRPTELPEGVGWLDPPSLHTEAAAYPMTAPAAFSKLCAAAASVLLQLLLLEYQHLKHFMLRPAVVRTADHAVAQQPLPDRHLIAPSTLL